MAGRCIHKYKGFETKEEAKAFRKEHGGYLCERDRKKDQIEFWGMCMSGLDGDKYPYAVSWNEWIED